MRNLCWLLTFIGSSCAFIEPHQDQSTHIPEPADLPIAAMSDREIAVFEASLKTCPRNRFWKRPTLVVAETTTVGHHLVNRLYDHSVTSLDSNALAKLIRSNSSDFDSYLQRRELCTRTIDVETIREFKRLNQQSFRLPEKFTQRFNVRLLSADDERAIWKKGYPQETGWKEFERLFPELAPEQKGYHLFSRVAFSDDGRTALVYRGFVHEGSMGTGTVDVYRLTHGKWKYSGEKVHPRVVY